MRTAGLRADRLSMLSDRFANATSWADDARPQTTLQGPSGYEHFLPVGLGLWRFPLRLGALAGPRPCLSAATPDRESDRQHQQIEHEQPDEDVQQDRTGPDRLLRMDVLPCPGGFDRERVLADHGRRQLG